MLNCYNCSFVNNSGNWAGVVYNCNGAESYFVLCDFVNNTHYKKDGADVYNFNYGNAFFVNGNSVQQKYGYPPSGVGYEARKACTYLISFGLGLTLSLNGCPGLGIFLGTFVGTALDVVNDLDYAKDNHHFSYSIFADMPKSLFMHFISSSIGSDLVKTNIKTVESPNQNKINPNINQKEPMADEFSTKSDLNNNINNQNEINPNIGENEPVVAEFSTKSDLNNNINNLNEREFNVKVSEKNINLEKEAADLKLNENKVVCEINGVKYYETDVLLRNGKEIVLSTGDGVSDFISYRYDDLDHLDMFEDKALNNFNSNHVGLNDYFEYQNTYQMLKYK